MNREWGSVPNPNHLGWWLLDKALAVFCVALVLTDRAVSNLISSAHNLRVTR